VTLPAFAAERRAAARGCGAAAAGRPALSIDIFARTALSSKPTARRCCVRQMGQTDRRTDGRTPDRFMHPAPHTMRTVSKSESSCQIADAQPH